MQNPAMIHCVPRGICSWDFDIRASGHTADAEINWLGEQGRMTIDGERYDVQKHGVLSGRWTLDIHARPVVTAQKSSAFARTFELETSFGQVQLRAQSVMGRSMLLEGAGFNGVIAPVHPFTRRASITGQLADFRTACFAFWLTVLLWRRATKDS